MKKLALSILTCVALALSVFVGMSAVAPQGASAASCLRTVNVAGQNAFGMASFSSLQARKPYVRSAAAASICVGYSATTGYTISSATCSHNSARLTSDSTSVKSVYNRVAAWDRTYLICETTVSWKWSRAVAGDQCASLWAYTRWNINRSTGAITHIGSSTRNFNFIPQSGC
jgi:hypothetical protein